MKNTTNTTTTPSSKKAYEKPSIRVEGDVEKITLKRFGAGDAFMLSGHGAGTSNGNNAS